MKNEGSGWHRESRRHSLAARKGHLKWLQKNYSNPLNVKEGMENYEKNLKTFEVTFAYAGLDWRKRAELANEYGFGNNPPAIFKSISKKSLARELAPLIAKDDVKIISIEEV